MGNCFDKKCNGWTGPGAPHVHTYESHSESKSTCAQCGGTGVYDLRACPSEEHQVEKTLFNHEIDRDRYAMMLLNEERTCTECKNTFLVKDWVFADDPEGKRCNGCVRMEEAKNELSPEKRLWREKLEKLVEKWENKLDKSIEEQAERHGIEKARDAIAALLPDSTGTAWKYATTTMIEMHKQYLNAIDKLLNEK